MDTPHLNLGTYCKYLSDLLIMVAYSGIFVNRRTRDLYLETVIRS